MFSGIGVSGLSSGQAPHEAVGLGVIALCYAYFGPVEGRGCDPLVFGGLLDLSCEHWAVGEDGFEKRHSNFLGPWCDGRVYAGLVVGIEPCEATVVDLEAPGIANSAVVGLDMLHDLGSVVGLCHQDAAAGRVDPVGGTHHAVLITTFF